MVTVSLASFPIGEVPMMTAVPVSKMKSLIWILTSVLAMGSWRLILTYPTHFQFESVSQWAALAPSGTLVLLQLLSESYFFPLGICLLWMTPGDPFLLHLIFQCPFPCSKNINPCPTVFRAPFFFWVSGCLDFPQSAM